jgi:predicted cobalt transporter CbtA
VLIRSLREVLKAAVLAGLLAALAAAGFHWIFTEPLIDRAVAMEEHLHGAAEASAAEPVVSRPVQKLGLFIGFLLYGGAWGILFGLLAYAIRPWLSMAGGGASFFLALLLGWSVAIFPLLKYPANPPGVGEAETIGYRQELFLLSIALSLIGTLAALAAERSFRHIRRARVVVLISYPLYLAVIFVALPSNPDPVQLPLELVREFRALSLAGHVLFWTTLAGAFWWLCGRQSPPSERLVD